MLLSWSRNRKFFGRSQTNLAMGSCLNGFWDASEYLCVNGGRKLFPAPRSDSPAAEVGRTLGYINLLSGKIH